MSNAQEAPSESIRAAVFVMTLFIQTIGAIIWPYMLDELFRVDNAARSEPTQLDEGTRGHCAPPRRGMRDESGSGRNRHPLQLSKVVWCHGESFYFAVWFVIKYKSLIDRRRLKAAEQIECAAGAACRR
jgi:hypothetical protein